LSWCLFGPAEPMTTSTTRNIRGKRRQTIRVPARSHRQSWTRMSLPCLPGCAMHYSLRYRSSGRLNRNSTTYGSDTAPDTFPSLDRWFVSAGCGSPPLVSLRLSQASTSSSIPRYLETRVCCASEPRLTGTQSIKGTRNQQYARDTASALRELSI
jgi:hypothetical protein